MQFWPKNRKRYCITKLANFCEEMAEESHRQVVSRCIPRMLLPANSIFPGKWNSQEKLPDRSSWIPRQVLYVAQEELWVVRPGEENRPWPNTKLLL